MRRRFVFSFSLALSLFTLLGLSVRYNVSSYIQNALFMGFLISFLYPIWTAQKVKINRQLFFRYYELDFHIRLAVDIILDDSIDVSLRHKMLTLKLRSQNLFELINDNYDFISLYKARFELDDLESEISDTMLLMIKARVSIKEMIDEAHLLLNSLSERLSLLFSEYCQLESTSGVSSPLKGFKLYYAIAQSNYDDAINLGSKSAPIAEVYNLLESAQCYINKAQESLQLHKSIRCSENTIFEVNEATT